MGEARHHGPPFTQGLCQGSAEAATGAGDADAAAAPGAMGVGGLGHGFSLGHPWGPRPLAVPPLSDAALQALFAPYCGGVARETELLAALQLLNQGEMQGFRPVEGGLGHPYVLRWPAVRSPLEPTSCQLRFPERPELHYDFELVTHRLVSWLMDCREEAHGSVDLPDGFWQWLLVGVDPDH